MPKYVFRLHILAPVILVLVIIFIYHQLFLFGKIPFPGDLLVASYSPWFDYYKLPVKNPLISDVFSQFFLWKYLAVDIFKNGQWPLWNPYSFTGTPLLATYHSATLYPLNLFLFLPKYLGWGLFIFSQTIIAALGMYLLLSLWLKSKLARLTGSIIFALAGPMTTWVELGTAVHGISYLPLSLFLIESYSHTHTHRIRYPLFLILTLTLIILSGNPQVTIYSFIIVFLFAIVRLWDGNVLKSLTNTLPIFLAGFLSLSLTAIQLLPSFELLQKSIRATEGYIAQSNFGLLPIKDFLKFFVADFFGNPVTRNYFGFLNYSETSGFVGSLTLPIIIFSIIFLKKNKEIIFFFLLFLFSLILVFDNLLSKFIYQTQIPLLTSSFASRMLFVTTFSVSILSSFALNQILTTKNQLGNFLRCVIWSWSIFAGITLGALIVYQIIKEINMLPLIDWYKKFYLQDQEYKISNFIVAVRNSLIPLGLVSTFLLFLALVLKVNLKFIKNYKTQLLGISLFVLLTIDLGRYFLKFNPFVPQEYIFPTTPVIEYLKKQQRVFRIGREHAEVLPPNTWIAYDLQSLEGYDPLYLNQYGKFIHFLNGGDLRYGGSSRYAELSQSYSSPFIDAANVKFFIGIGRNRDGRVPGDLINYRFNEADYSKVFQDKSAVILENPNAKDRVYFAKSSFVTPTERVEEIFMTNPDFDPKTTALLSKNLQIKSLTGQGSAIISTYSPNLVTVKTQTESEELLVLADQFDEGWRAKVDGKETEVARANLIFRAVKVPAGNHEIIFYYWPESFDVGLKISIITIAVLGIICLVAFKRRIL